MKLATTLRFYFALWLGKAILLVSRLAGKTGTTLPGAVALKIYPELLARLSGGLPRGAIVVTGTNGKTTTSNLLAEVLRRAGMTLTFNRAGANLVTGITSAFLEASRWDGRNLSHLALLEVDEAAMAKVIPLVKPQTVVITNFFRDQLDRYGELDKTVALVKDTINTHLPDARLVLNADDPLVAQIGANREGVVYYGVAPTDYDLSGNSQSREAKFCSFCGHAYEYELYHYGQLGIYICPGCGFKRPAPDVLADEVQIRGTGGVSFSLGGTEINLQHQGFYSVYNALAAAAAALGLGMGMDHIKAALDGFTPEAGRMEQFVLGIHRVTLSLVKNPTGFNEVIRAMIHGERPLGLLIAINDNAADGRDVSWLWDVDFEQLVEKTGFVVCSGLRAEDMAVRLKYAGLETEKLYVIKDLAQALNKLAAKLEAGQSGYVLPTYTALFPTRQLMSAARSKAYAS